LDSTQLPKFFSSKQDQIGAPQAGSLLARHNSMKQNSIQTKLIYSNLRRNESMDKHSLPAKEPLYDLPKNKYRNLLGNSERYVTGKELIENSDIVGSAKNIFSNFEQRPKLKGNPKVTHQLNKTDTGKYHRGPNYDNFVIDRKFSDLKTKDQTLQDRRLEATSLHRQS
jgi:hypothetical protein